MREPTISTPSSLESVLPESPHTVKGAAPFALTIFVSAFLLFQVQPLIAKQILPWFGGSAAVWTTCMLFFQIALLLGYSYAHWMTRTFEPRRQALIHVGLLCVSMLSLPIVPSAWWKPSGSEDPLLRILGLMAATIGLPYFLLSSTSPLLQAWMARTGSGAVPYRFFALSNLGSMLALLSYPVLVEPNLANRQQAWGWSAGYVLFAALCGFTAFRTRDASRQVSGVEDAAGPAPTWNLYLLWATLAASASALLLSITSHLTENVASIPFLWVLPLALYLLSFILCFESSAWYRRVLFLPLFVVALGGMSYGLVEGLGKFTFPGQIAFYLGCLFVCCMVCHGELARTKPSPAYLTGFYLMTSVGGAAGGLFVAFLAPRVFNAFYEFPISIVVCALAALVVYYREQPAEVALRSPRQIAWLLALLATAALADYLFIKTRGAANNPVLLARNFYGALRVNDSAKAADQEALRELVHGTINHGEQYLDSTRRRIPITYYGPLSGVGIAVTELQASGPLKVAIVGLGTGTMAAYSRAGDTYRFYEINPLPIEIARKYFTYLSDSKAKIEIELGDARLTMEREAPQGYDMIAVDAFSGDSIPVHLLTREAFELYWKHLKPDGVLAIHISNRYLDLAPVVAQVAAAVNKPAVLISSDEDDTRDIFSADWVLVTNRASVLERAKSASAKIPKKPNLRLWTDDYSNLWQIVK